MEKLISKINSTGMFGGELQVEIKIRRTFEGYHGIASETWETEYEFNSSEIKGDSGRAMFPSIFMKSKRWESFNDFIKRVEEKIETSITPLVGASDKTVQQ